jgi:hypothetical protein
MRHADRLDEVMGKIEEILRTKKRTTCAEVGTALLLHPLTVRNVLAASMCKRGAVDTVVWRGRSLRVRQGLGLCWDETLRAATGPARAASPVAPLRRLGV